MNSWPKRIWRCLSPLVVYVIVNMVVMVAASFAVSTSVLREYGADMFSLNKDPVRYEQYMNRVEEVLGQNLLLITGIGFLAMIPILVWMHQKDRKRLRVPASVLPVQSWALLPIMGAALCLCLNGMISITPLSELLGSSYESTAETIYSSNIVLQYVSVGLFAPIAEELMFRGLMYKRMRGFLTTELAIMISAIVFGLYHGNALQFLYALLLGFVLAYIYEAYRSVIATIVVHASANLLSVLMTNRMEIQNLIAKDKARFTQTTIICAVISFICLGIIIYWKKKGEEKNE